MMTNIYKFICRNTRLFYGMWLTVLTLFPRFARAENPDKEYLEYCVANLIEQRYVDEGADSLCWACDIVNTLMKYMTETIQVVYNATKELSIYILVGGASIWIAVYFLKAVGSFATQDPAKIIDGLLTFCFKIAVLYLLVANGIDAIMEYIVNPLLSIGFDIGTEFSRLSDISQ